MAVVCSRAALSDPAASIGPVSTTTNNFIQPAQVPVHQPAPFEKWLAAQPTPYQGRHRGPAAVETSPRTGPGNGPQPVPFAQ